MSFNESLEIFGTAYAVMIYVSAIHF